MRFMRKLGGEGGFSLAELLVAGIIISIALVPITKMFDTAFTGIRAFESTRKSIDCAKEAMEVIRSMPFYEPYNPSFGKVDIDDNFWGTRDPQNYNPGTLSPEGASVPDWDNIPEVKFYGYGEFGGYPSCRVGVKLSYLKNDTGVASIKSDWGPMTIGKDRPVDIDNKSIHLLLVQVNVYWKVGGGEGKYTVETVVTDTEAIYDLGVSSITVLGPESVMYPGRSNAAAHWPDATIQVQIKGWGFKTAAGANLNAKLVRDKNNDIPITITSKTSDTIVGTLNLHNTGTDIPGENDWFPKAAVGYWSVKVNQESIYSTYLFNGFVVMYPKPVISNFGNNPDMSKSGLNNNTAASLRIEGGPFVNKVKNPAVRLIRYGENNKILDQINGAVTSVTVPSGTFGYTNSGCAIIATFNLAEGAPGEYRMHVVNTDDPTMIGHAQSDPSSAVYTIVEVFPQVNDAYVNNTSPPERRIYCNAGNPWRLRITGNYFGVFGNPPLTVYICSEVVDGQPAGYVVQGTDVGIIGTQAFLASFDFSALPEGNYKVYVRNADGRSGWTSGAPITLVTFNSSLTNFFPTGSELFWENYYDIPSKITGTGLDQATKVTIISTTATTTEYDITSDCTLSPGNIDVNLNLISCSSARSWKVRVYFLANYYLERSFTVSLGPAKINPANNFGDSRAALYILRENGSYSYETQSARAYARTSQRATFYVNGEGFPMAGNGQTTLRVWRGSWSLQGNYTPTLDRANKIVRIQSATWNMTSSAGDCGISVQRVGDTYVDSYATRWYLSTSY